MAAINLTNWMPGKNNNAAASSDAPPPAILAEALETAQASEAPPATQNAAKDTEISDIEKVILASFGLAKEPTPMPELPPIYEDLLTAADEPTMAFTDLPEEVHEKIPASPVEAAPVPVEAAPVVELSPAQMLPEMAHMPEEAPVPMEEEASSSVIEMAPNRMPEVAAPAPMPEAVQPQQPAVLHTPEPVVQEMPKPAAKPAMGLTMPDMGILNQFMQDQEIGEVMVNGTLSIYIDRKGKLVDSGLRFNSHEEIWEIADRMVKSVGQELPRERPVVDSRLPDGSRVNIIAPPMALDGVSMSIRKFPAHRITMDRMVESGQLTPEIAQFLAECIGKRMNTIVCGGTGSGKTTLLNALSSYIGNDERVVTIEDAAELRLQQPHVVRLEAKHEIRQDRAHLSVSIRDLVKNALRMRPDRIVVGESRGAEALDVLQAMNTGHDGSMTSLHANTPRDALSRLETMVALAMPQLPIRLLRAQIASTVNLIINMARCKDGVRRIMYVSEVAGMEGEIIVMQDLITCVQSPGDGQWYHRWANCAPKTPEIMEAARSSGLMRNMR